MTEFLAGHWSVVAWAVLLAVCGVVSFWTNFARYQRVTGYAFQVALMRTLAFVVCLGGMTALAWALAVACFAPGVWRNLAVVTLTPVMLGLIGAPAMAFVTRIIEVRHHL